MYRWPLLAMLSIGLAGCRYTECTNPLFTENELIADDSLIGDWKLDNLNATVASAGHKVYRITIQADKTETTTFHVLKVGDHHFVDFETPDGGHAFARISILGDHLYTRSFSGYWLEDRLRRFPNEIAHRIERRTHQSEFLKKTKNRLF